MGIRHCSSGHLDVVAAEEEEHDVTTEAEHVEEDDQLSRSFRLQLKSLENVAAEEDADASAGDGNTAGEHACHALRQIELSFQIFGKKNDESGHDDQLHASSEARHDVDLVGQELPGRPRNVFDVFAVVALRVFFVDRLSNERARA